MYEQTIKTWQPPSKLSFVFRFKSGDVCCPNCSVKIHNAKRNVVDPLSKSLKACNAEVEELLAKIAVASADHTHSADVMNNLNHILLSLLIYKRTIEEFCQHPCLSVSRIIDFEFGKTV
jgi:uncharacterized Zn finger protein (UPF0148 family)